MKYKDTISYQLLKIRKVDFYLNGIEKGMEKGRVSLPQEMQVRSLGREDPLEEEMATHSSIPAWIIPWTDHGSPKVRHN